jgi:hypothetical protein
MLLFAPPKNPHAPTDITKKTSRILECDHCSHHIFQVTILFDSSPMSAPPMNTNIMKKRVRILEWEHYLHSRMRTVFFHHNICIHGGRKRWFEYKYCHSLHRMGIETQFAT